MTAKDAIKIALTGTQGLVPMYLGDLSDADLLVRPAPGANHIAWQMGHLISSEVQLISGELPGAVYPELPAGFKKQHNKEASAIDPPSGFASKADYLSWFGKVRDATVANVDRLSDADLDTPTKGPMAAFAPNLGALILLVSNHTLMHAGQFTAVRRKLGKPVIF
jgi:hypothetical protein